ncbi:MAG: glutaredoxin [Pseudomonadota bacterium]|nr:MAG: glutaredoxin [Pseudomonadota bacterium]
MDTQEQIKKVIEDNSVMLFMKGNPDFPQCGFSGRVVQILNACGAKFASADVLADDQIRQGIKDYSNWPPIPQLYINGEFVGGAISLWRCTRTANCRPSWSLCQT